MTTIKNLNELRAEQRKLDKHSSDLQDRIHSDWKIVRGVINTRNIFQLGLNCTYAEKNEPANREVNDLRSAVGGLFKILTTKAGDSLKSKMKEKLQTVINNLLMTKI